MKVRVMFVGRFDVGLPCKYFMGAVVTGAKVMELSLLIIFNDIYGIYRNEWMHYNQCPLGLIIFIDISI